VLKRDWIMPTWFARVEEACAEAEVDAHYVFVVDRRDPTVKVIDSNLETFGRKVSYVNVLERINDDHVDHAWANPDSYHKMVDLRNYLLAEVRYHDPKWFLSLDSDILCHPLAIANLLESSRGYDAVGGKVYLSSGRGHPSYANLGKNDGLIRKDADFVMDVDVIMAMKLMSRAAYGVDYVHHRQGEDIGWSKACTDAGLRLGWDGRITSKHVMRQTDQSGVSLITKVDQRCGF
jgi:hypothetical protein